MEKKVVMTPYRGMESQALVLRNQTRTEQRDRTYMDWRYLGQQSAREPEVYWIHVDGRPVGMVGVIYRPYIVTGKQLLFPVLGDISLLPEFRGTGLIDELIRFVNSRIQTKGIGCGLVIPNVPAMKVLARNGWEKGENLVHHVLYLRPQQRFATMIPIRPLAWAASRLYSAWVARCQCRIKVKGYELRQLSSFTSEFSTFWEQFDKDGVCMKEMSVDFLRWRYDKHPELGRQAAVYGCYRNGRLVSFLVAGMNAGESICTVYDILALDSKSYLALLKMALGKMGQDHNVHAIRYVLNEGHPSCSLLRQAGFSPRREATLFQLLPSDVHGSLFFPSCSWYITSGDKDV